MNDQVSKVSSCEGKTLPTWTCCCVPAFKQDKPLRMQEDSLQDHKQLVHLQFLNGNERYSIMKRASEVHVGIQGSWRHFGASE